MVAVRQDMIEVHQEKSGSFPAVSRENSQTNVIIHQEMVGIRQETVGIYRKMARKNPETSCRNTASMFLRFFGVFLQEPARAS